MAEQVGAVFLVAGLTVSVGAFSAASRGQAYAETGSEGAAEPAADASTDDAASVAAEATAGEETAGEGDEAGARNGDEAHAVLLEETEDPSAFACKGCHPIQFRQWSVSGHAQAHLSPAVRSQENEIKFLSNGTSGDSCGRCHNPVGMMKFAPSTMSNMDLPQNYREGVTCIVCHRQDKRYGKTSANFQIQAGGIFDDIFGPSDNTIQREAEQVESLRLVTSASKRGRAIHNRVVQMPIQRSPIACAGCHSARGAIGLRNEETFDEYRTSPSAREGVTCQDCHMGSVPGENKGFDMGPAAEIGEYQSRPRRLSNHYFAGPDFPVIHPGIFPHNPDAVDLATYREWLQFDHRTGWGTDAFEENVTDAEKFPEPWADAERRKEARAILDANVELLGWADDQRLRVLRAGYHVQDVVIESADARAGLAFKIKLQNAVAGHNAPSGFIHERMVFFQVTVTDSQGAVVFRSGDRDPNGDLRVRFSNYVTNGELALDTQLFNLQSHFEARTAFGANRVQYNFTPYAATTRPFIRPPLNATSLMGRPDVVRTVKHSIEPLGHRWAHYEVEPEHLKPGETYTIDMKLISQQMPGYFLYGMSDLGFDYGLSLRELVDRTVKSSAVVWERTERVTVAERRR